MTFIKDYNICYTINTTIYMAREMVCMYQHAERFQTPL